jgi:hypothetical protein
MKSSWHTFFRRLAAVVFIGVSTTWSSARSYAQVASDNATNAPYANGWQEGDNGGSGFGPWSFAGSYNAPANSIHLINSAHPENDLGQAWTLSLDFDLDPNDDVGFGLARAGRALNTPLQIGQTLSIVFDNPTEHRFFKGYTLGLYSGNSNIYPQNEDPPLERFAVWSYHDEPIPEDRGQWRITPSANPHYIALFDEDTDAGARLDFTLTGLDSYSLKVTPLDQPANAFMTSGLLANRADFDNSSGGVADGRDFLIWQRNFGRNPTNSPPGPTFSDGDANGDTGVWVEDFPIWVSRFGGGGEINWIQFTHYDELRDPVLATDFYISSLQVVNGPPPTSAIPEPDCIFMASIGMMGAVCVRHRRRTIIPSASDLDHSMSRIIS